MIKLLWPTEYGTITQHFGLRPEYYKQYGLPGHEGLDFKAPTGSRVFACADGTVKLVVHSSIAGGNYGIQVRITHEGGRYETIYAHLDQALVDEGQIVRQGDVIGYADSTGNSSGSHLHLTLKVYGDYSHYAAKGYGGYIANPTPFLMKFGERPMRNLACGNIIQVGLSDDEILALTAKLRPEFMTVTSRPGLAVRMIREQGIKVIYRRWPDDGANAGNFLTNPEGFVDWVAADRTEDGSTTVGAAGVIISLPNEPALTKAFADATLRALRHASKRGLIVSFGNFPTGNPEPRDWPLLAEAIEFAYLNGHILNLHEYWSPDPIKDYGYHVGRFLEVYRQFGTRVPRIVMGEIGYAKNYDPHQGWYGNISPELMANHLRVVHSLYKKYNIAYCVFSFGHWPTHQVQTGDFDVVQSGVIMDTLNGFLGDLPMGVPLPPGSVVMNGQVLALPGTNTYQNIRSGPGTSYTDVGDLKRGDYLLFSDVPAYPGWYWVKVGSVEGWTAKSVGGSPLLIDNITQTPGYDPLEDLRNIQGSLNSVITRLEGN